MKLEYWSDLSSRFPDAQARCRRGTGDVLVDNGSFGAVLHAVVTHDDGQPVYDLPIQWDKGGGAVIVPIAPDGGVCFVEQLRPVAAKPDAAGAREPPADLSLYGRVSLELPRGFSEEGESWEATAIREASEELRRPISDPVRIGYVNPNTATTVHSAGVFVARAGSAQPGNGYAHHEPGELIIGRRILSDAQVFGLIAIGEIFCGFTMAAYLLYLGWRSRSSVSP